MHTSCSTFYMCVSNPCECISSVTWSDKKGLTAHGRKSNFLHKYKATYVSALLEFSVRCSLWYNWSASAGWPSGDLNNQSVVFMELWWTVCTCQVLWCWIKTYGWYWFAIISECFKQSVAHNYRLICDLVWPCLLGPGLFFFLHYDPYQE